MRIRTLFITAISALLATTSSIPVMAQDDGDDD